MSGVSSQALYSPSILGHAVSLANYPVNHALKWHAEVSSRVCGSTIEMTLDVGVGQKIIELGLQVKACAIGQASAAIFAAAALGKTSEDIAASLADIDAWLEGSGPEPDWPQIGDLAPALPHRGRHEAIRLPWRAALAALSRADGAR